MDSFLFLLLSYALTQPSPKGRGSLATNSWHWKDLNSLTETTGSNRITSANQLYHL